MSTTECWCQACIRRANAASSRSLRSTPRTSAPSARPVGITSTAPAAARRSDVVATVNVIAASQRPYLITCREHSTRRPCGKRERRRSMTQAAAFRPSHYGLGAAAIAQLEIDVARIDENSEALAQDENRVADIEGVEQEQHAAADREEPEGDRHHHFSRALGGDPLHREAHGEHDLRHVTEQHPPLELGHEDLVQVAPDRL